MRKVSGNKFMLSKGNLFLMLLKKLKSKDLIQPTYAMVMIILTELIKDHWTPLPLGLHVVSVE